MAYYIFLKSWRRLEEFRKNPHLKISPKSPSTNFQSLAIIKNQIFIRKIIFLHFRPIRPNGQPAYSDSRPMPPPGLRPIARPSWPTQEVVSLLATQPPPRQATMTAATFPTSPSPYGRLLPLLNPSLNRDLQLLFIPPFNPRRWSFPNSSPGARPLSPPGPYKRARTTPGLHHTSPAHSPPLPKLELPGR
jgi:hypothetical protein